MSSDSPQPLGDWPYPNDLARQISEDTARAMRERLGAEIATFPVSPLLRDAYQALERRNEARLAKLSPEARAAVERIEGNVAQAWEREVLGL